MPAAPPSTTSSTRRTMLRTTAAAASAAAVAPVVLPVVPALAQGAQAAATTPALGSVALRSKAGGRCRKVKVRVKGRTKTRVVCKPKKKPTSTPTGTPTGPKAPTRSSSTPRPPATPAPPAPVPLPPGGLLSAADRHVVSRFSYGVDRAQADQALLAGGGAAWFDAQLAAPLTDPATDGLLAWWPSLGRSPQDLWARERSGAESGWRVMSDYQRYVLVRRMRSTHPVRDLMAEFWENHFNVPVMGDGVFTHRVSYGSALRERALGTFEDLLRTAVTHPAMLIYLNAGVATKARPNENLGRELLELHTVGRGRFTEDDVKSSARILTGYRVDVWNTWVASYKPADHWTGAVRVMDFTHPNTDPDGRAVAEAYLRHLAHHPATAERIARKLAVKLVSDEPSQALVDQLAAVYLAHGTAIAPVLRALVASAEFAASAGTKVRDPAEDVIATYKALGLQVAAPTPARSSQAAETVVLWQSEMLGQAPHSWPRPDGAPTTSAAWSSTSRLLASLELHFSMSGGWWPKEGVSYRRPVDWLPAPSVTFADLVEHLSREILHMPTPPGLLLAAGQAVGAKPQDVITATHPVIRWKVPRLLTTVLDTPHFMKR